MFVPLKTQIWYKKHSNKNNKKKNFTLSLNPKNPNQLTKTLQNPPKLKKKKLNEKSMYHTDPKLFMEERSVFKTISQSIISKEFFDTLEASSSNCIVEYEPELLTAEQ